MDLYEALCYFLIYAFLGWCLEVVYAAVARGEFVNRGMFIGPVCPIYGFGFVFVIVCLTPVSDKLYLLFPLSALLATALELVGGFLLEKAFCVRWWDYSKEPFNLGGYICLKFSLLWGLCCVVAIRLVHPPIRSAVEAAPRTAGWIALAGLYLVFIVDGALTLRSLLGIRARIKSVDEVERAMRTVSDRIGEALSGGAFRVMDAAEHAARLRDDLYGRMPRRIRRMMRAFPHVREKYTERITALTEKLKKHEKNGEENGDKR